LSLKIPMFEILQHQYNTLFQYISDKRDNKEEPSPFALKLLESLESDLESEGLVPIFPSFGDPVHPETMKFLGTQAPEDENNRPIYKTSPDEKHLYYSMPDTVYKVHTCGWKRYEEHDDGHTILVKAKVTIFGKSKLPDRKYSF